MLESFHFQFSGVTVVSMSQPINNHLNPHLAPGLTSAAPAATPQPQATPTTSTAYGKPESYTHMPDGSWADAQVELSSQINSYYEGQMAYDNMMFQSNMMLMQSRAISQQRTWMNQQNQLNKTPEAKLSTGPEMKSAISYEEGGEGGEE